MTKPIVFLSHSSVDEKPLKILKELLFKKTGGAITLFLSSDGQSIPLGRNWVHELQEALDNSQLMFVFISTNSLKSSWIHFEVGYAYSKNIRVIPVAINGLDLGQVAPPLSLLQGFNINSNAGLNNLIAIINQEFNHVHEESFTPEDFESVFAKSNFDNALGLSPNLAELINGINTQVDTENKYALNIVEKCLESAKVEFNKKKYEIVTHGMNISLYDDEYDSSSSCLRVDISSELIKIILPIVSNFIEKVLGKMNKEISVSIDFVNEVSTRQGHHNITARLYGTKVKLGLNNAFQYKDIKFEVYSNYMKIYCTVGQLQNLDIEDLLEILFAQNVLMIKA